MSARRHDDRRGSVLAVVLIFMVLVAGLAATLFNTTRIQHVASTDGAALGSTLYEADALLACAKARLEWELAPPPGGNWAASTVKDLAQDATLTNWITDPSGATCDLTCLQQTPTQRVFALRARSAASTGQVRSTGQVAEVARRFELIIQFDIVFATAELNGPGAGAIVAFGPVRTLGAFKVDGRDYDADLDPSAKDISPYRNAGNGAPAITSTGTIDIDGSSQVAGTNGSGTDTTGYAKDGTDGVNVDSGTSIWTDGSYGSSVPANVDAYYGVASGTLKAKAQADGTYFTSLADYNAYVLAANSTGPAVSSKVLYLEVANGSTVPAAGATAPNDVLELPKNPHPASDPAIVVVAGQNPDQHDVSVGPVHANNGVFQGVFMSDKILRMNGNGALVGQVVSWTDATLGDTIGNGTFDVYLSKEVLGNLPTAGGNTGIPQEVTSTQLLWREYR